MEFFEFVAERYNYWIFIVLMMTGLYVVIARGNLIKKLIGLNVFQTSVFIYYISIGKIVGGTAPIYVTGDMETRAGGHGGEHDSAHALPTLPGKDPIGQGALHADPNIADGFDLPGNDLASLTGKAHPPADAASIHAMPSHAETGGANDLLAATPGFHVGVDAPAASAMDAAHAAASVVYSNPLPHVLILTAIVVGIATTAVGLALVVRIREAYGTIEEDELEAANDIAEFGAHPNEIKEAVA